MREGFPPGLLLVTDRSAARAPLAGVCAAALDAGFAAVMLREKDLEARELHELALPLAALCRERGKPFLVNDRLDVALALPGAGGHVGKGGIPVADARRALGPGRLLGYSAHAVSEASEAVDAGADYVFLSPVFPSRSKPGLAPRGPGFLEEAAGVLGPGRLVALGGITAETVGRARVAGAAGAAVMGAVMRSDDHEGAARALVAAWDAAGPGDPAG